MRFPGLRYTLPALLLATTLNAQSATPPHTTQFWLTGGAGPAWGWNHDDILPGGATAWTLAASMQHGVLLASVRTAQYSRDGRSGWDAGALIGAASPARYSFWGSAAAGLGLSRNDRVKSEVTVPLEVQLGWRFSPNVGVASYLFGGLSNASAFGATFGLQIGRMR